MTGRLARAVLAWATGRVDPGRREWIDALGAELDVIDGGGRRLAWALGAVGLALTLRGHSAPGAAEHAKPWWSGWNPGRTAALLLGAPPDAIAAQRGSSARVGLWPILGRAALIFVPVAAAATIVLLGAQQMAALAVVAPADEARQQLAESAAAQLDAGHSPESVLPAQRVDMARSVQPFLMVFDRRGSLLSSSVEIGGRQPVFPSSVFDNVSGGGEDHVSWMPQDGVRGGVVVIGWRGGYVVAGSSDRLIDEERGNLHVAMLLTEGVLVLVVGALALVIGVLHPLRRPAQPPRTPSGR